MTRPEYGCGGGLDRNMSSQELASKDTQLFPAMQLGKGDSR